MGTIHTLHEAGLDVEFDLYLDDYFIGHDDQKAAFRQLVDDQGLKNPTVMKRIGELQKTNLLKPGIYKEFVGLFAKLSNGDGGHAPAAPQPQPQPQQESQGQPAPQSAPEGTQTSSPVPVPPDKQELSEDEIANYNFSSEQEAMIKQRLEAEEEKIRQRLLAREKKIRENIILGRQQRQVRLGLKAEDAAALNAARDAKKVAQDKIKVLREEIRAQDEIIKKLRPTRIVTQATHEEKQLRVAKRKHTMATKTGDEAAIAAAQQVVEQWEQAVQAQRAS